MTIAPQTPISATPWQRIVGLSAVMGLGLAAGCAVAWAMGRSTGPRWGAATSVPRTGLMLGGSPGLAAPVAAALACWVGGVAAIAAEHRLRGSRGLPAAMLAGTALRLGPPLAMALAARLRANGLWEAGLPYYLGAFFIVVLCTETLARLPRRLAMRGPSSPPEPGVSFAAHSRSGVGARSPARGAQE